MISVDDALERITGAMPQMPVEQIALADALGRVLAEDLAARRTQPPMAVSAMDGYAVRADDVQSLPATLKVIGAAPAGEAFAGAVGPGQTVRIFTGGPVPEGADSVDHARVNVCAGYIVFRCNANCLHHRHIGPLSNLLNSVRCLGTMQLQQVE